MAKFKCTAAAEGSPFQVGEEYDIPSEDASENPPVPPTMWAKMAVTSIVKHDDNRETLHFNAVCKKGGYPEDGADEDNTFARFSPAATLEIYIANPALFGKFHRGQKFYLDFTESPDSPPLAPAEAVPAATE